ncbi:chromatin remodeling 8 isoform X2 [Wolffia australiana]
MAEEAGDAMEEEEDRVLLRSLGVDSANPEDIERDILRKAENAVGNDAGNASEEFVRDNESMADPSSVAYIKLHNKLRAVEIEIDAVASSIEPSIDERGDDDGKTLRQATDRGSDGNDDTSDCHKNLPATDDRLTLQQALTADRLRSLEKTRDQLKRELDSFDKNTPIKRDGQGKLLGSLVKDEPKKKSRRKETESSATFSKKRAKTISYDEDADFDAVLDAASGGFVETEKEVLIRKGLLTPFHRLKGFERRIQEPGQSSSNQHDHTEEATENLASSSILRVAQSMSEIARTRPTSKLLDKEQLPKLDAPTRPFQRLRTPLSRAESLQEQKKTPRKRKRPLPEKKWRKLAESGPASLENEEDEGEVVEDERESEEACVVLEGGLKIPDTIFSKLFDYQKVGVQWLWELHCQRAGGIIGDEMGLGKTIQVISFLAALHFSGLYKPSIVICPVTLLRQWQREAHKWYPKFQVHILHDSAHSGTNHKEDEEVEEEEEEEEEDDDDCEEEKPKTKCRGRWDELILQVIRSQSGLLLTTYEQLRIQGEKLLEVEWGYAVLDEGHRIRNPNAEVTLVCKQLQTVHRIIMTGAPIQNKLAELWSLFDFVFPGKLGVLPVFEAEFAVPITVGGYANATPLQVSTAYRCAVVLRDLILPYLLRRVKADVHAQLPKKTEQVLFCSLTPEQRDQYRAFLASTEVEQIFDGSRNSLYGIDVMRKICNHPDLLEREHSAQHPDYGNPARSGKMKVIDRVLRLWKEQHHRVLLFAQTQQMLDILESFLKLNVYEYRRMDGLTPVKQRMALIDEFNLSTEVFVFLLTTKVGGLGTNLTGADRVLIYDPDWNPSTDMQARERAWRIGQTRDVTVYRLITRGTIEEKVYHRQIYKHFLTNKILKNPQQRRFFRSRDLKDLFTLQEEDGHGAATETSAIFGDLPGEAPETKDEETNVLKSLFDASGIHSAMDHEAIVNANDGERTRFEQQAAQVAQRAAEALRRSRLQRSRDGVAVPTWTGRSGSAGAPPALRRRFGAAAAAPRQRESNGAAGAPPAGLAGAALSSAAVLARIRGTEEEAAQEGRRRRQISGGLPAELLVRRICTFLQERGGAASSEAIVAAFRDGVPAAELPLFKNLLKEIAVLEKSPRGSSWVLKPDYR